jgi:hypothetical protein
MSHDSFKEIHKYKKESIIKFGLISSNSSDINIKEIFTSYFKTLKEDKYKIKRENHYEFNPPNFPHLTISIIIMSSIDKIKEKYSNVNFFMLFIDMQDKNTINFLDKAIDAIISAGDECINKKCYIIGFYSSETKILSSQRATTIIEAKGIDYYFSEIKKDQDMIKKFSKLIELMVNDTNTIMVEKFLDQKHSELILDNSKSKCIAF